MADQIIFKSKDICDALELKRHKLRLWVSKLAPYCHREKKERSAAKYDSADLLYFSVVKHLTEGFHLPLSFISDFSESLYVCIREPQSLSSDKFIFICKSDEGRHCVNVTLDEIPAEGIVVNLRSAQERVYHFLGLSPQQTQLQLGLMEVN